MMRNLHGGDMTREWKEEKRKDKSKDGVGFLLYKTRNMCQIYRGGLYLSGTEAKPVNWGRTQLYRIIS